MDEVAFSKNVLNFVVASIVGHANDLKNVRDEDKNRVVDTCFRAMSLFLKPEYSQLFQIEIIDLVTKAEGIDEIEHILNQYKGEE
jgi:hypothetical protein